MVDVIKQISDLFTSASQALTKVEHLSDLENFFKKYLAKKSQIDLISKSLKKLPESQKKAVGLKLNAVRSQLNKKFAKKEQEITKKETERKLKNEEFDFSRDLPERKGSLHPLSQVQREVENIFSSLGFEIASGPELETEWHNFDALNIAKHHPARDMQDTFWVEQSNKNSRKNYVLRTQTSNVQIRAMKKYGVPIRLIAPGRVFRNENVDASHDAVFSQVEGLVVDRAVSLAHIKGTVEIMLRELFQKNVKVRFRPGYFPFVEPGFEIDFGCTLCSGRGCVTCKKTGWIEFMGGGMIHPSVLRNCNINPEVFSGFAFGFGLTRLVMMKYEISDIRLLLSPKLDFLKQF